MNLNAKFKELLIKHNIGRFDSKNILGLKEESIVDLSFTDLLIKASNELINKLDGKIIIRGAGAATKNFLYMLEEDLKNKISYINDNNITDGITYIEGVKLVSSKETHLHTMDYVIIPSFDYRFDMIYQLNEIGIQENKIIDLHAYYEAALNTVFQSGFFLDERFSLDTVNVHKIGINNVTVWYDIVKLNQEFTLSQLESNYAKAEESLYKIIITLLRYKDIVNAKKNSELYISYQYKKYEMFVSFFEDLDAIMNDVKTRLNSHLYHKFIVFHIDSFQVESIKYTSYLKDMYNNAVVFNYAYSNANHTSGTLKTMFTGKDYYEDNTFELESLIPTDKVPSLLEKNNYIFQYNGLHHYTGFFKRVNHDNVFNSFMATESLWETLCSMLRVDNNAFYYNHIMETHFPFLHGLSDEVLPENRSFHHMPNDVKASKLLKALNYIDEQLAFYNNLYTGNITRIFLSDHGSNLFLKLAHRNISISKRDFACRITFFVHHSKMSSDLNKSMLTLLDFDKIIECIIQNKDIAQIKFRDYVCINSMPVYDKNRIKWYLLNKHPLPMPKRGVVTQEGIYIIDYYGNEEFYTHDNVSRINDIRYSDVISQARERCGTEFRNCFEQPKFVYAKQVYTEQGLI